MKIKKIYIEKFRAIKKAEIDAGKVLALVGQNSSGKSSILRALNCFFNFDDEKTHFELSRHSYTNTSTAAIDIEFEDTPADVQIPRVNAHSNNVRIRLKYKRTPIWNILSNGHWIQAPANLHSEISKAVHYVYVPLRRDHHVAGWGDQGLLRSVVEAWIRKQISRRDTISPKVEEVSRAIKSRVFDGLTKQLRKITPMDGDFTFHLDYTTSPDYSLLLRDLVLRVSEGITKVDLEDCGSGTQSMTAFAMYSYLAELEGSTYILGIEEPEQNLHPQAQRELLANLRKLPLQIIFTTHSTVILDELDHEEVILCRKTSSTVRGVEILTTQLKATFWAANALDKNRYYQFHKRRNSEFFFSKFIILTESPIDSEIVRELLLKSGVDLNSNAVSILSLDGVKSLPYAFHLLKTLNLAFATVVDKDYFLPYLNDELDLSRDPGGFPKYRRQFQASTLIDTMVPDLNTRNALLGLLSSNHSKAMDILEKSNVFCFKWSLDIDLINSSTARQILYRNLAVPVAEQNSAGLLIARKKMIKKLETLLPVVQTLKPSNLPNSYNRLRKVLPLLIKKASG